MINYDQTILGQYGTSPTLVSLLSSFNDAIDPSTDIQAFYNNIWNINTAVGYGLDVWGQIVNVSRTLKLDVAAASFGFAEAFRAGNIDNPYPFNTYPFYTTQSNQNYILGDDAYRKLIICKALANISNCTIPKLNDLLRFLFPPKDGVASWILGVNRLPARLSIPPQYVYVSIPSNMVMQVNFKFKPSAIDLAIIKNSGVFPVPAGVTLTIDYPT